MNFKVGDMVSVSGYSVKRKSIYRITELLVLAGDNPTCTYAHLELIMPGPHSSFKVGYTVRGINVKSLELKQSRSHPLTNIFK